MKSVAKNHGVLTCAINVYSSSSS